jgi:hypothetical protein
MRDLRMIQAAILKMERRNVRECSDSYLQALGRLEPGQDRFQTQEWANFKTAIHRLGWERRFSKRSFARKVQA